VPENITMHRRGIQIPSALPKVAANSLFRVRGKHLLLGPEINLDLSPASIWVAPRPKLDKLLPFEDLPDRLWAISCLFDNFPPPSGFGCILSEITKIALCNPLPAALPDKTAVLKYAWPALNEIVQACIANDFPRILRIAEDLVGLGEGLTPSGDDFIGGLLFSSFALQQIYTQHQGFTLSDVELFLDNSRNRTNLISYTMLKDLAAGQASDTLHRFINAILTDNHLESTYYFGLELVRIGHSTGWDMLTGVWTGLLLSLGSRAALSCSLYSSTSSRY
jgi:hypothetical protein